MGDFEWPQFYGFPPFFTLQPNHVTREKQIELWCDLVLSYCRHHGIFKVNVADLAAKDLFHNKAKNRKLKESDVRIVLDELKRRGNLEWLDRNKTQCQIIWKSTDQWAALIYSWAEKTGQINSVCTVFEIHSGEASEAEEFHGLDQETMMKALDALEKQGKAAIFTGNNEENTGVKFF
eukprot:Clim_evm79s134 gene=Clim_evmTU79s134